MTQPQFPLSSRIELKHRKVFLVLGILLFAIIIITIHRIHQIHIGNKTSYKELITNIYPSNELLSLKADIEDNMEEYNFERLNQMYKFQCIRKFVIDSKEKTDYRYAVLLDEKGSILLIYFLPTDEIWDVAYYDYLPSEADFDFVEVGKTTAKELERKNFNAYNVPVSSRHLYTYLTKEGVIMIQIGETNNIKMIIHMEIVNVENCSKEELEMLYSLVPQMLEIDKTELLRR